MNGDEACAEGAVAAGCTFFAGYPITPATEVAERMSLRLPQVEGVYIQMEDELASMAAVVGAACAGARAMTSTSGPGFSLMMENVGLAAMLEVPCVLVNIMRGGPSTGLPTLVGQQDVMQARWGSHGDYEVIALAPESPQEAFEEAYAHEQKVTKMIHDLVDLAGQEKDHASFTMLQWFVEEQVEEEASVDEVLKKIERAGDGAGALFMIDRDPKT